MNKSVYKLRENNRVQQLGKGAAPQNRTSRQSINISFEHGKNCPECGYCGAMLPHDEMFQKKHMEQVHGMVIIS